MAKELTKAKVLTQAAPRKSRVFFYFLAVVLASLFVLILLAKHYPYFPIDLQITLAIQRINLPFFTQFMWYLTYLGNPPAATFIPVIFTAILVLAGRRRAGLMLFISTTGVVILSETLKRIVARPRPDGSLIIQVIQFTKPDSFPSGHVLYAIGLFGFLAYLFYIHKGLNKLRNLMIIICILLVIFMGVSRIYLGAHWFSDTLGSYLVGTLWLWLMAKLYHRLRFN